MIQKIILTSLLLLHSFSVFCAEQTLVITTQPTSNNSCSTTTLVKIAGAGGCVYGMVWQGPRDSALALHKAVQVNDPYFLYLTLMCLPCICLTGSICGGLETAQKARVATGKFLNQRQQPTPLKK
jgi:hypothetical protein